MKPRVGWWKRGLKVAALSRRPLRPIRSLILRLVRELVGLTQQELGDTAGYQKSTISYLERGKETPSEASTERLTSALGVSPSTLNELLAIAGEIREGETEGRWIGPVFLSGEGWRRAWELGRKLGNLVGRRSTDSILRAAVEEQAAKDRETASQIGMDLRKRENLPEVVRGDAGCHLWSVAEWLCGESLHLVAKQRDRAAECAEAARVVADLVPGEERFRSRLSGCIGSLGT